MLRCGGVMPKVMMCKAQAFSVKEKIEIPTDIIPYQVQPKTYV